MLEHPPYSTLFILGVTPFMTGLEDGESPRVT